jgi:hypothetical protein
MVTASSGGCGLPVSPHRRRNRAVGRATKENTVKQDRTTLPTRLEAGGVCIQAQDWADLNVARIRFPKGADATPLLEGMPQNL